MISVHSDWWDGPQSATIIPEIHDAVVEKKTQDDLFPNMCFQVGLVILLWNLVYYLLLLLLCILFIMLIMQLTDGTENI